MRTEHLMDESDDFVIARCQTSCDDDCAAPCHESHEVLTRRHHDVAECEAGQRRWAEMRAERDGYYRQWMSTRETVHKLQARIDAAVDKLEAADRLVVDWQPSLEEWSKAVSLIINARGELKPFQGLA